MLGWERPRLKPAITRPAAPQRGMVQQVATGWSYISHVFPWNLGQDAATGVDRSGAERSADEHAGTRARSGSSASALGRSCTPTTEVAAAAPSPGLVCAAGGTC